jgi:hypothetical protein
VQYEHTRRSRVKFRTSEDERGARLTVFDAVNRGDVGMVERREELRFPSEAHETVRVGSDGRRQELQGDVTVQRVSRAR